MIKKEKEDLTKPVNTELVNREDVVNSPFSVVTTEEGSFGVLGKWRITEVHANKEIVHEELSVVTWNRIMQVISLVLEANKETELMSQKKQST